MQPLFPTDPRVANKTYQRQRGGGRKPKYSNRLYFSAIVYVLRTGIISNALPREKFGGMSSSALHDKFQQWSIAGVLTKIWQRGLAEYDEPQGIAWTWQAADSTSIEASLSRESTGPNPTDWEKKGSKRHILVDENGIPISLLVSAANQHDSIAFEPFMPGCRVRLQRRSRPGQWLHPTYKPTRRRKEADPNQSLVEGVRRGCRTDSLLVQSLSKVDPQV